MSCFRIWTYEMMLFANDHIDDRIDDKKRWLFYSLLLLSLFFSFYYPFSIQSWISSHINNCRLWHKYFEWARIRVQIRVRLKWKLLFDEWFYPPFQFPSDSGPTRRDCPWLLTDLSLWGRPFLGMKQSTGLEFQIDVSCKPRWNSFWS